MYFNSQRIANIDSLRSLAVLSVFFYHLGYLDWGFSIGDVRRGICWAGDFWIGVLD